MSGIILKRLPFENLKCTAHFVLRLTSRDNKCPLISDFTVDFLKIIMKL